MGVFRSIYLFSLGVVIEEITEEATVSSKNHENSTSASSVLSPQEAGQYSTGQTKPREPQPTTSDYLGSLKDDPEPIRFILMSINKYLPLLL